MGRGGEPARCEGFVRHTIQEMNAWVEKGGALNGTIGSLVITDTYRYDAVTLTDDGIGASVDTDVIMDETLAEETKHRGGLDQRSDKI